MINSKTFFFYDLETSGLNARFDRIMQFAGQRTDMNLNPIGEPTNLLIKMTDDTLPSPEAIILTGITPQQTVTDGISEAEFAKIFVEEIATPDTIMVGYNNIRFDDEFMRHFLWRNFRDPYEWVWVDGRSRWDLLDVVRLVRALRPDGTNWPFIEENGKKVAANKLELLAKENGFENQNVHDAWSDVLALINLAKLLKEKQPRMFDYLLKMRSKKEVANLINLEDPTPFVYASGRYSSEFEKTTVALAVAPSSRSSAILVWDLRQSPDDFVDLTEKEILAKLTADYETRCSKDFVPLPVKELSLNRCPAIAPLGTLDDAAQKRLKINLKQVEKNFKDLKKNHGLIDKIVAAWDSKPEFTLADDVEGRLYESFTPDVDKPKIRAVAAADKNTLADFNPNFVDERLPELLFRYKARNFPKSLSEGEQKKWENWRTEKLARELPSFMKKLSWIDAISRNEIPPNLPEIEQEEFDNLKNRLLIRDSTDFLLQEMQLWAESIMPFVD